MFRRQSYKPPPSGWTKRALTHWDCSDFGLYTTPVVGWILEGDIDVEWVSSTFKATMARRAPWLGGRLANTENGFPRYEVHVPPLGSGVESLSVTVSVVEDPIRDLVPYQPYGSTEPFAAWQPSNLDFGIFFPQGIESTGVNWYIKGNKPLMWMHVTKGPDVSILSFAWPHCLFDGLGWSHLVAEWKAEMNGDQAKSTVNSMSEKPESFFDFTDEVELDPTWVPFGWIPATVKMWAQAFGTVFKNRYVYSPSVNSTIIIPKWIVERWKAEAREQLPKDIYVSSNDLVFAWYAKHNTSPYPATERMTLISTICLRMRCPQLPPHLLTNTSTSYVLPDNFSVSDLQRLSIPELALAFRRATLHYKNPDNVLRSLTFEHRRVRDANGARTMFPLVNPNQKFLLLDSIAGLGLEKIDVTKRENGIRGKEVRPLAKLVWFGNGMQMISGDAMGGFRITGFIPKVCFESLKKALEQESSQLKGKL